jgi:hypothetical protein
MGLTACRQVANQPLPPVKAGPQEVECDFPLPAALQVGGPELETCIPDTPGDFHAEVGMTISTHGHVIAVRIPETVDPAFARCVRRIVPAMKFLVPDPCHRGSASFEWAFSRGGVP